MAEGEPRTRRRWLVPEAVQASPMDCGPAALHALATGFGLSVSFARLREACQTDVDGTSIDALERVARELGLEALQVLVPGDHVGHPRAATLPAIAVTRLPGGTVHFVLVWRRVGRWLQVMDPGSGRRWIELDAFRRTLYIHGVDLPAELWRRFAGSKSSAAVLTERLASLGHRRARERVAEVLADPGWRPVAALEAAARMAHSLAEARAVAHGAEAERLIEALFESARGEEARTHGAVPAVYWSVRPHAPAADGSQLLHVRGAVLVRTLGLQPERAGALAADSNTDTTASDGPAREIARALAEPALHVGREVWRELRGADRRALFGLSLLSGGAAALVLVQALLFRALFELGPRLRLEGGRLSAALLFFGFVLAVALLELPLTAGFLRLGRHLEARLRVLFQERLPLFAQRWFGSRPASDMAERAHGLFLLRQVPTLAGRGARALATLGGTALGLCWLDPGSTPLVLAATLAVLFVPFVFLRLLSERELLVRSHHGALSRFYFEALLGLVAVRVHGAGRALRREHESLLVEWSRAGLKLARGALGLRVATSLSGAALAIGLFAEHLIRNGTTPAALLFGYWSLALPALGEQLALVVLQAPALRNAALRALEPLNAPLERPPESAREEAVPAPVAVLAGLELKAAGALGSAPRASAVREAVSTRAGGVAIELRQVSLTLGGHVVLREIDLELEAGEHVALVGRSGAGKSSLIGLLLGFQRPGAGELRIDGWTLAGARLEDLRRATAWVDPGVQLWNKSAFENLVFGLGTTEEAELARTLEQSDLRALAGTLPQGLATPLGEGGSFLSGGEGQRVRLARGLLRPGVRLALLDEPFRGLEREGRRRLLARARAHWRGATLLAATHDLADTLDFDRVLVMEAGRIVEAGAPRLLAARADSRYARLLAAEEELLERGWHGPDWTRWRVADGRLAIERAGNDEGGLR